MQKLQGILLAIESSCDDTSAAIVRNDIILSNIVHSQLVHSRYGGVIPEVASRAHQDFIIPVVSQAMEQAGVSVDNIDAVAVTQGPGLLGSLLVGISFAKGLAQARGIPLIGVNHMLAHIHAHFIATQKPQFPFLCLTVSGGHTQLVLLTDYFSYQVLGQTIDDAAGEAFDKAAKMLHLPYPGGPLIDKYSQNGDSSRFLFPFPSVGGYNYSFSGIKTAILYFLQKETQQQPAFIENNLPHLCASIQAHIVAVLLRKLKKAAIDYRVKDIGIAGGVSANSHLREEFKQLGIKHGWKTWIPAFDYCTDNAAMIAKTAWLHWERGQFTDYNLEAKPRFPLI